MDEEQGWVPLEALRRVRGELEHARDCLKVAGEVEATLKAEVDRLRLILGDYLDLDHPERCPVYLQGVSDGMRLEREECALLAEFSGTAAAIRARGTLPPPPAVVPVRVVDLDFLLIYAVRYALGRQSYAVAEMAMLATRLLPDLPDGSLNTLERDLRRQAQAHPWGQEWEALFAAVVAEQKRRAAP